MKSKTLFVINEITVSYWETPADQAEEIKTLNFGMPVDIEPNKYNIELFVRNCLKKEIFEIVEFKITEKRPC